MSQETKSTLYLNDLPALNFVCSNNVDALMPWADQYHNQNRAKIEASPKRILEYKQGYLCMPLYEYQLPESETRELYDVMLRAGTDTEGFAIMAGYPNGIWVDRPIQKHPIWKKYMALRLLIACHNKYKMTTNEELIRNVNQSLHTNYKLDLETIYS